MDSFKITDFLGEFAVEYKGEDMKAGFIYSSFNTFFLKYITEYDVILILLEKPHRMRCKWISYYSDYRYVKIVFI